MIGISIVVPVYNKRPHLERMWRSIVSQEDPLFEVIFVDDGSSDGSREYVLSLDSDSVHVGLRDEPGPGGYAARNLGIKMAKYDWIAFLDADDEWLPGYLAKVRECIASPSQPQIIGSAWVEYSEIGGYSLCSFRKFAKADRSVTLLEFLSQPAKSCPICGSTAVVRKDFLNRVGGFPEGKARRGGDVDTWLRVLLESRWLYWNAGVGAIYHRNSVNMVTKSVPFIASAEFATAKSVKASGSEDRATERALSIFVNNRLVSGKYQAVRDRMTGRFVSHPLFRDGINKSNLLLCLLYSLPRPFDRWGLSVVQLLNKWLKAALSWASGSAIKRVVRFFRDGLAFVGRRRGLLEALNRLGLRIVRVPHFRNTFFGYFDVSPFCPGNESLMACCANDAVAYREASPTETAVILFDLETGAFEQIDTVRTWNWQQGCRLQWLDEHRLMYNADFGQSVVSRIYDRRTKRSQQLPYPVQAASRNLYASLSYKTLSGIPRHDYGYGPFDQMGGEVELTFCRLSDGGVEFTVDSQRIRDLVGPVGDSSHEHVNHGLFNPTGATCVFLYRYYDEHGLLRHSLLLTDVQTRTTRALVLSQMISHYVWRTNDELAVWGVFWGIPGYYLIQTSTGGVSLIYETPFDGHPSLLSPETILSDTYKLQGCYHKLITFDFDGTERLLAEIPEAPYFWDSTRCDLHAKAGSQWTQMDVRWGRGRSIALLPKAAIL